MKKILILANEPLSEMHVGRNGTLTLALAFAKKSYEVFFAFEVEIGSRISGIRAQKINFHEALYDLYENYAQALPKGEAAKHNLKLADVENLWSLENKGVSYDELDLILNRLDPVADVNFTRDQMDKLRIVNLKYGTKVNTLPQNIDKYEPLLLSQNLIPDTIIFSPQNYDISAINKMLHEHGALVIKPAKSAQGRGVEKISVIEEFPQKMQKISAEFNGKVEGGFIVQQFLEGAKRGDVRTIFYRDEKGNFQLGGHVARTQLLDGFVNSVACGFAAAAHIDSMLSAKEISDLEKNCAELLQYFNKHKNSIDTAIIGVDSIPKFASKSDAEKSSQNSVLVGEINFLCSALFNLVDHLNAISVFEKNSLTQKIINGIIN
jgi:glutathione synthase/RimK-type ligase-like ATP-grasp enzyme